MVELSDQEKNAIRGDGGGILVFTKEWKIEIADCDGNVIHSVDEKDWINAGVVVVNGQVKMHHTNDMDRSLQYLQVHNDRMRPGSCKDYKSTSSYKVTVEVLTLTQAAELLHRDRFEPFDPSPRPNDPYGPFDDEVGVGTTKRPWRRWGNRDAIPRATASANFSRNCCCGETSCEASSSGTSGSKGRSDDSYYLGGGPNPWNF